MGKSTDYSMEIMTVTPSLAKEWLETNKANRRISTDKAKMYARDMREGKWQLTPQGVSFNKKGDLIDGQHRLMAVILANIPVEMVIFRNVPDDVTIFDRGRMRTTANTMAMHGFPSSVADGKIIGAINFLYEESVWSRRERMSDAQIIDFVKRNMSDLSRIRSIVGNGANHGISDISVCYAAAFCAMFNGVSENILRSFFKTVNTGFYTSDNETPAIVLRNYLQSTRGQADRMELKHKKFSQALSAIKGYLDHEPRKRAYQELAVPFFFPSVRDYILNNYVERR